MYIIKRKKFFNETYILQGKNLRPTIRRGENDVLYHFLGDLSEGYQLVTDKMCSTTRNSISVPRSPENKI